LLIVCAALILVRKDVLLNRNTSLQTEVLVNE